MTITEDRAKYRGKDFLVRPDWDVDAIITRDPEGGWVEATLLLSDEYRLTARAINYGSAMVALAKQLQAYLSEEREWKAKAAT
jgi:hypothetical protein